MRTGGSVTVLLRRPSSSMFIFDKGWSARAAVLACGGAHHELGAGGEAALAFQPLRRIDEAGTRGWADMPEPISVKLPEAVRLTGLSRSRIYELMRSGDIEYAKVGSSTLILVESLRAFVGSRRLGYPGDRAGRDCDCGERR